MLAWTAHSLMPDEELAPYPDRVRGEQHGRGERTHGGPMCLASAPIVVSTDVRCLRGRNFDLDSRKGLNMRTKRDTASAMRQRGAASSPSLSDYELWKRRVEAEARSALRKGIRGVGGFARRRPPA
jgi:hypothetical protein